MRTIRVEPRGHAGDARSAARALAEGSGSRSDLAQSDRIPASSRRPAPPPEAVAGEEAERDEPSGQMSVAGGHGAALGLLGRHPAWASPSTPSARQRALPARSFAMPKSSTFTVKRRRAVGLREEHVLGLRDRGGRCRLRAPRRRAWQSWLEESRATSATGSGPRRARRLGEVLASSSSIASHGIPVGASTPAPTTSTTCSLAICAPTAPPARSDRATRGRRRARGASP